jgi:glycosyltransferase involved in cell wall biosynthesis
MRVLNYLEFAGLFDRAGIGTSASQQVKAIERADADIEVITRPWVGETPMALGRSVLRDRQVFESYDLAHCNLYGPGSLVVARHAQHHDIPLVLHAHTTKEDFAESFRFSTKVAPTLGRYLRWFYSQADLVLCPSEYTKSNLETYPVTAPIRPITNGIDLEAMLGHEALRDEYRERFDLDGMVVFAVGSVFERKGLTTFCEVAQDTDFDFAWFGTYDTGPEGAPVVKRWVNDPPENVTFTGWIDDKRGGFGAGDVMLFPSKDENQGIVVLEAMACGKAVVLSDIPVFREFFTDGEDCLMCSSHDEYVDALERLADDPALRARLGENARETAAAHSLDHLGAELTDIYRDLAGKTA